MIPPASQIGARVRLCIYGEAGAASAVGGLIMLGVGLRMLDIKQVRVVNLLPALLLAPLFVRVADLVRAATGG